MNALRRWLDNIPYDNADQRSDAFWLQVAALIAFGCSALALVGIAPVAYDVGILLVTTIGVCAACGITVIMLRRGDLSTARMTFVFGIFGMITLSNIRASGPLGVEASLFALIIGVGGFVLSPRQLISLSVIAFVSLPVIVVFRWSNWVNSPEITVWVSGLLGYMLVCAATSVFVYLTKRGVTRALERNAIHEAALRDKNLDLMREIVERREAQRLTEKQARELEMLLEVSNVMGATPDLTRFMTGVIEHLKRIVGVDGAMLLEDDRNGVIQPVFAYGPDDYQAFVSAIDWTQLLAIDPDAHRLVELQQVVLIGDLLSSDPLSQLRVTNFTGAGISLPDCTRAQIFTPLIRDSKVVGALVISSATPNLYHAGHIPLFRTIAASVSAALERMRLHESAVSAAALGERSRIARELHDSVSQSLFGIVLGLRTIKHTVDIGTMPGEEQLNYVNMLAEAALNDTRALVFELRPEYIEREGLLAAIDKQARTLGARHQIAVETQLPPTEPVLPLKTKEALYRITLEAIQNALKHAAATRIDLHIMLEGPPVQTDGVVTTPLRICVRDNGRGFDPAVEKQGHYGMLTMRERAAQINASIIVDSTPGSGAEVRIELLSTSNTPRTGMRRVRLEPVTA
jgi:signal transduction histidine kinase